MLTPGDDAIAPAAPQDVPRLVARRPDATARPRDATHPRDEMVEMTGTAVALIRGTQGRFPPFMSSNTIPPRQATGVSLATTTTPRTHRRPPRRATPWVSSHLAPPCQATRVPRAMFETHHCSPPRVTAPVSSHMALPCQATGVQVHLATITSSKVVPRRSTPRAPTALALAIG